MKHWFLIALFLLPIVAQTKMTLAPDRRIVTILATNDIHGGVEPSRDSRGTILGGMAFWSGVVRSIREGIHNQFGDKAGVLVVDGGDQFQGTLISNYNEGQLVFATMSAVGYDAVVPGNHDYDFGPTGWLDDQVNDSNPDKNPRGALEQAMRQANFPLIASNVYMKASMRDTSGRQLEVSHAGCRPESSSDVVDWSAAERFPLFVPAVVKTVAGVRVALIGLDNEKTPSTTTFSNVSDLCFRDEVDAYLETRHALEGHADLFVLIVHDGNTMNQSNVTQLVRAIHSHGAGLVHAVVAGHTHFVNNLDVDGVPIIQSGSGGRMFGRIDLVWDAGKHALVPTKTRHFAGAHLFFDHCGESISDFCAEDEGGVAYEGVHVELDPRINELVARERETINPLARRKLGVAVDNMKRDRIAESPMANAMTDALRGLARTDIAMLNTGGIRDVFRQGDITYEDLFRVFPFSNHAVVVGPASAVDILHMLQKSAQTCGAYGAIMQSGLMVEYQRDCSHAGGGVDRKARLVRVKTVGGDVLLDTEHGIEPDPNRTFMVATIDFLVSGGEGGDGLGRAPLAADMGVLREALTEKLMAQPLQFTPKMDGRWKALGESSGEGDEGIAIGDEVEEND